MDLKFQFATDADRAAYGDQWYTIDPYQLGHVDCGLLEEIEEATGLTVLYELPAQLKRRSIKAMRAMMWIAVRVDGRSVPWDQFKPAVLEARWEADAADVKAAAAAAAAGDGGEGPGEADGPNRATRRAAAKPAKQTGSTRRTSARSGKSSASTTSG